MSTNCNCKNTSSNNCASMQTLDEIYKIQRRILEGSKCGNNTVIINDSVMTYVPDADFPVPICDNVRATIVNYTERNYVKKETFQEIINQIISAINDLDKRVKVLEGGESDDPYDPILEQITLDDDSVDEQTENISTDNMIPVDVVEG